MKKRSEIEKRGSTEAWSIAVSVTLVNLFANLDRYSFSFLLQPIKAAFHASDTQMGMLSGLAFVLCNMLFTIPMARWVDIGQRRVILIGSLVAWSVATFLSGFATTILALGICRAAIGIAESGATPASLSMLSDSFPRERRHQAVSLFQTGAAIAPVVGIPVIAGLGAAYSWRVSFFVAGAAGIVLAIILSAIVREPARGRFDDPAARSLPVQSLSAGLREIGRNRGLVLHVLSHTFVNAGTGIMLVWMSAYAVRALGLTISQMGMVTGASGLFILVSILSGGWICGWMVRTTQDDRRIARFCALCGLLIAPAYLAMLFAATPALFVGAVLLASAIFPARIAPAMTLASELVAPSMRGLSTAILIGISGLIGAGIAPVLTGMVSDHLSSSLGSAEALRAALAYTSIPCLVLGAALGLASAQFIRSDDSNAPAPALS